MAAAHLAYLDLALDKFSGTDPNQDAESFLQVIERETNFNLRLAAANPDALADDTFRKSSVFRSTQRSSCRIV